ncbi:cysteine peptidase family C39 domain-containing protein [Arthrobacter sp. NA-172]|uniref:cysteine peptidase family C39 domain-containing protein n=1 Tax=Arthrobacter sp. NA-172 TaxID=3367524 RepID=UPI00375463C9
MVSHDWQALGFPSLKAAEYWDGRSCGVACLRMAYGRPKPGLEALPATITEELLQGGAYSEESGWNHEGLATHARHYGLKAERLQFPTLEAFIDAAGKSGVLMVSIGHSFEREGKSGHLAVVAGITNTGHLWIHRPSSRHPLQGRGIHIDLPTFWDHFSGRGIHFE